MSRRPIQKPAHALALAIALIATLGAGPPSSAGTTVKKVSSPTIKSNEAIGEAGAASASGAVHTQRPEHPTPAPRREVLTLNPEQLVASLKTVAPIVLISLAPMALLVVTSFVRINIVLVLLRQALGSPQIPGNQVLTALALLLTALVMRPVAEQVYSQGIEPYQAGRMTAAKAWDAGTRPIKVFMVKQIVQTNHADYLRDLYELATSPDSNLPEPKYPEDFPFRVVAPAFLLSELTTALVIGFSLYLPFLVIDLVVSAVLAAMGLFMLPPSLVALPLKLILFVLANGWLLVATMLLKSFAV